MEHHFLEYLKEFFSLIAEYCAIPVALWAFTYLPKIRTEKEGKIYSYGYEFLLIESLAYLSVFLRISTSEKPIYENLMTALTIISSVFSLLLAMLLFVCILYYGGYKTLKVKAFEITFYASFFAWWIMVGILGYFSQLFVISCISLVIYIGLFTGSFLLFRHIIYLYFVTADILLLEVSSLNKDGFYKKAQKRALRIIRKTIGEEGEHNYTLLIQATEDFAYSCYLRNNVKNSQKGINLILPIISSDFYRNRDISTLLYLIVYLYCITSKTSEAELCIKNFPEAYISDETKEKLITMVKEKKCNNIFPEFFPGLG